MSVLKATKQILLLALGAFAAKSLDAITKAQEALLRQVFSDEISSGETPEATYTQWLKDNYAKSVAPLVANFGGKEVRALISATTEKFPQSSDDSDQSALPEKAKMQEMISDVQRLLSAKKVLTQNQNAINSLCSKMINGKIIPPSFLNAISGIPSDKSAKSLNEFFQDEANPKNKAALITEVRNKLVVAGLQDLAGAVVSCKFVDREGILCLELGFNSSNVAFLGMDHWETTLSLFLHNALIRNWLETAAKNKLYDQFDQEQVLAKIIEYNNSQNGKDLILSNQAVEAAKEQLNSSLARLERLNAQYAENLENGIDNSEELSSEIEALEITVAQLREKYENAVAEFDSKVAGFESKVGVRLGSDREIGSLIEQYSAGAIARNRALLAPMIKAMLSIGLQFFDASGRPTDKFEQISYDDKGLPNVVCNKNGRVLIKDFGPAVYNYGLSSHAPFYQAWLKGLTNESLTQLYRDISGPRSSGGPVKFIPDVFKLLKQVIDGGALVEGSAAREADPRAKAMNLSFVKVCLDAGLNFDDRGKWIPCDKFQVFSRPLDMALKRYDGLGATCDSCNRFANAEFDLKMRSGFLDVVVDTRKFPRSFVHGKVGIVQESLQTPIGKQLADLRRRFGSIDLNDPSSMPLLETLNQDIKDPSLTPACMVCFLNSTGGAKISQGSHDHLQPSFFAFFHSLVGENKTPFYEIIGSEIVRGKNILAESDPEILNKIKANPLYLFAVNPILAIILYLTSGEFTLNHITCSDPDHKKTLLELRVIGRAIMACLAQTVSVVGSSSRDSIVCPVLKLDNTPLPQVPGRESKIDKGNQKAGYPEVDLGASTGWLQTPDLDYDDDLLDDNAPFDPSTVVLPSSPAVKMGRATGGAQARGAGAPEDMESAEGVYVASVSPVRSPRRGPFVQPLRAIPLTNLGFAEAQDNSVKWSEVEELLNKFRDMTRRAEVARAIPIAMQQLRDQGDEGKVKLNQSVVRERAASLVEGISVADEFSSLNPDSFEKMNPDQKSALLSKLQGKITQIAQGVRDILATPRTARPSSARGMASLVDAPAMTSGRPRTASATAQTSISGSIAARPARPADQVIYETDVASTQALPQPTQRSASIRSPRSRSGSRSGSRRASRMGTVIAEPSAPAAETFGDTTLSAGPRGQTRDASEGRSTTPARTPSPVLLGDNVFPGSTRVGEAGLGSSFSSFGSR